MIVLALDTASEQASVAIRRDGETLVEITNTSPDGHAHVIYSMIQSALDRAQVTLVQIDCFAAASGPGAFTGVRICLAAIKGMAEATGKPAVAISNLRALATFGTAPVRNPIIDARRGQIYTALYDEEGRLLAPEILTTLAALTTDPGIERIAIAPPLAAAIAFCAKKDGHVSWSDPAALDANYVRKADAELAWLDPKR